MFLNKLNPSSSVTGPGGFFLVSSDTDIIPAILEARIVKKKIIYVGFEGKLSRAMMRNCLETVIIKEKMIREINS